MVITHFTPRDYDNVKKCHMRDGQGFSLTQNLSRFILILHVTARDSDNVTKCHMREGRGYSNLTICNVLFEYFMSHQGVMTMSQSKVSHERRLGVSVTSKRVTYYLNVHQAVES